MIKCKCGRWFGTKKGHNIHYSKMHKHTQKQKCVNVFDFNEIKLFITSEIQRMLKEFNFNSVVVKSNEVRVGIVPIKNVKQMPVFDPFESNKRLVIKELKESLLKGIGNVLKEIGSFDDQLNFLDVPIKISV